MKKIWVFILGMLAGAVLAFVVLVVIGLSMQTPAASGGEETNVLRSDLTGKTYSKGEGRVVSRNSFKVIQVLESGDALACEQELRPGGYSMSTGLVVLFEEEDGRPYYDDQIIEVSRGQCVKQIGTYKYESRQEIEKTVPIVKVCDE